MSRTDIDPATLAKALRGMAGDGSIEWVRGPIQASVLLDVADALDENAKLRTQLEVAEHNRTRNVREYARMCHENDKLRALVADMRPFIEDSCPRECCLFEECDASSDRECHIEEHVDARMRDLGIEVGEC